MMPVIKATVNTQAARVKLMAFQAGLSREAMNRITQMVALRMHVEVVMMTPVRWFGQVRASWKFIPTETGAIIRNDNRIFKFLDQGTANQGTGFIYPKVKKYLFVPLVRAAAAGWRQGMRYGVDYILKKRVRGIKPLFIIERARVRAAELLKQSYKNYIRELLASPTAPAIQRGLATSIPSVLQSQGALPTGLATQIPRGLIRG